MLSIRAQSTCSNNDGLVQVKISGEAGEEATFSLAFTLPACKEVGEASPELLTCHALIWLAHGVIQRALLRPPKKRRRRTLFYVSQSSPDVAIVLPEDYRTLHSKFVQKQLSSLSLLGSVLM